MRRPKRRWPSLGSSLLGIVALTALLAVWAAAPAAADSHTQTVNLRVDGMVCPLCEQTVEAVVSDLPGIASIEANYKTSTAVVTYEPGQVTPEEIVDRINTQTYYEARVTSEFIKTATFKIPGLDTQAEADEIGQALGELTGVVGGTLQIDSLTLDYDLREISPEQVVDMINNQTTLTASIDTTVQDTEVVTGPTATAVIGVEGMTDDQAASRVTGALLLDGIVDGTVNTENATLTVVYDTEKLTAQRVVDTLRQATPYAVSLVSDDASGGGFFTSVWFVLALVLLVVVAFFAWPGLRRRYSPAASPKRTPRASNGSRQARRRKTRSSRR